MNEAISKDPLYNEIMKNRCLTCYKKEKRLVPLTEKRLLKTFVPEITLTHEDRVCESCDSMLKAMMRFKNTVLTAQLLLKTAYEQQSQDIEQKISITKISKKDIGHCSTLSFLQYVSHTTKHDTDIKEEPIYIEPALDDLEDPLPADPIPEDFIIHEEVEIKTETLSTNPTSEDEDHEVSLNGNRAVTEAHKEKKIEDIGHCSLSFEYFSHTTKQVMDIKEESIDIAVASDDLEDPLLADPIPEDFIIHEEVEIKAESTDTDQCSVDSEETLSANLTSEDEDHEISANSMWSNREVMRAKRVPSNSTIVNSKKNSPLLTQFVKNVPRTENKKRVPKENPISDAIKNSEKKSHDDPFKDGTIVMLRGDQAFIVKVLSEAEMQADREYKRTQPHYVESTLRCVMCILTYRLPDHYEEHMNTHSLRAGMFPCTVCQRRFTNHAYMEKHRKTHYIKYVCTKCDNYGTTSLDLAQQHYDRQHYVQIRTCKKCGAEFNLYTELLKHDMRVHSTQSKCTECGVVIRGKYNMKAHMARRHKGKKTPKIVECNVCKKKIDIHKLKWHIKTVHNYIDGLAYCIPCDRTFKTKQQYRSHLKLSQKHNTMESFKAQCEVCGRRLGSKKSLEYHMETVHSDTAKYPCEKCDHKFKTSKGLKVHTRLKHGNAARTRDKICERCGKGFFEKKTLEEHMTTHTGERPHSCADCGVSFGFRGALFTHRRLKHKAKGKKVVHIPGVPNFFQPAAQL